MNRLLSESKYRPVVLATALFFLSACATTATGVDRKSIFNQQSVNRVVDGVTTEADLIALFGKPDQVRVYSKKKHQTLGLGLARKQ